MAYIIGTNLIRTSSMEVTFNLDFQGYAVSG